MSWLIIVLFLIFVVWVLLPRPPKDFNGPRQLPLIYNMVEVIANYPRILDWFVDGCKKYGLNWTARLPTLPHVIIVADPASAEHVLNTNFDNYIKGDAILERGADLLGRGIFNTNGAHWKLQRKTASRLFSRRQLRDNMTPVFTRHCAQVCEHLDRACQASQPIDVQKLFYSHTLDSIGEIAFGINIDSLGGRNAEFSKAFDLAQLRSEERFWKPFWKLWPEMGMKAALKTLNDFAYGLIQKRRIDNTTAEQPDLLSQFMSVPGSDGQQLSDKDLRDIVMNLVIAGRDTTAVTLTWTSYMLATHPEVEKKVIEEIDEVLRDGPLDFDSCQRLTYLKAVVDETLRLYPPVPMDPKTAVRDDVLPTGQRVPAGSLVIWTAFCMGRMDCLFPNSAQFRPERWLEGATDGPVHPYAFIPFQAGPRKCLGVEMAYLETRMVLASIYSRYTLQVLPGHPVEYRKAVTLPARYGMKMLVTPRPSPSH